MLLKDPKCLFNFIRLIREEGINKDDIAFYGTVLTELKSICEESNNKHFPAGEEYDFGSLIDSIDTLIEDKNYLEDLFMNDPFNSTYFLSERKTAYLEALFFVITTFYVSNYCFFNKN